MVNLNVFKEPMWISIIFFYLKNVFLFHFHFLCSDFLFVLGLHFFIHAYMLECCYSAVPYLAGIQRFFYFQKINEEFTKATFSHQANEYLKFWGTEKLICATVIYGNLNAILLVFFILKYTCNHSFLIVCRQRSQNIRIRFDSMNSEMMLKNESACQGPDRLLVFMSGMCYQVFKGESMLHSDRSVCTETEESLSTFSPHTEPLSNSTPR